MMPTAEAGVRTAICRDIAELADFLDARPELPVADVSEFAVTYFPACDDDTQNAEVERVADLLDVEPRMEGEHYVAEHRIGHTAYRVVAIPERARARHRARMSYADTIHPD